MLYTVSLCIEDEVITQTVSGEFISKFVRLAAFASFRNVRQAEEGWIYISFPFWHIICSRNRCSKLQNDVASIKTFKY